MTFNLLTPIKLKEVIDIDNVQEKEDYWRNITKPL